MVWRRLAILGLACCSSPHRASGDGPASHDAGRDTAACAKFTAEAQTAPAAMLVVLDRSASMAQVGKWDAARTAVTQALDEDAFDSVSLGLLTYPEPTSVAGPACIFNFPIYCSVAVDPQIAVALAGTDKSTDASGVRHDIHAYLSSTDPETADESDSSPMYAALNGAYEFVRTVTGVDKRMVMLITDGGGSCTSISNPQRVAYTDGNGCPDWEEPPTVSALIAAARTDPTAPTETFVIGVPGSDSNGAQVGGYDTPPYSMRLALSTYAVTGSPDTVDPACDASTPFTQAGSDPAHPCHVDLSNNATFDAAALATAISTLRGQALGCSYALPLSPDGTLVDRSEVNVVLTVDGVPNTLPKRGNPADSCAATPCWDYDMQGDVELIGSACTEVEQATMAKVEIDVGCTTIVI
ncbi:MAG TPA: hypothetical protein VGM88_08605 [Kofleriaceae bacterium]